jgi:hypothetical protein
MKKAIAPRENVRRTTADSAAWITVVTLGETGESSRATTAEAKMQKLANRGGLAKPPVTRA